MKRFSPSEIFQPDFNFEKHALAVFKIQAAHNSVYRQYLQHIRVTPEEVNTVERIPFLPIELFKTHRIVTTFDFGFPYSETEFTSSGTSGNLSHHVVNTAWYEEVCLRNFELFYGSISEFIVLALLPSYLRQKNSSLVFMMNHLMKASGKKENGFYLDNFDELAERLKQLKPASQKVWLLGVTYALLDFSEMLMQKETNAFFSDFENLIVMETGGMKGRKKERIREDVHAWLKENTGIRTVHSEYGMTELMSQAYSKGEGKFFSPPWMKILIRPVNDPYEAEDPGKTGAVNIMDLANVYSCAFIATNDLGKVNADGSFEILGRMDNSDVRGCNLMAG